MSEMAPEPTPVTRVARDLTAMTDEERGWLWDAIYDGGAADVEQAVDRIIANHQGDDA